MGPKPRPHVWSKLHWAARAGCCVNRCRQGRREPRSGRRLEFLTSLDTKGESAFLRLQAHLSAVGDRQTSCCQGLAVAIPSSLSAVCFFFFFFSHSFFFLSSFFPPLLLVAFSGPSLAGEFEVGRDENTPAPSVPPEPPFHLSSFNGTCGFAPAHGHAFFPCAGLMHLLFLFRASGTQQFSPTGKYKADGVLETVRLSGKLSRNLWLCVGTVSFHISKSFLSWG